MQCLFALSEDQRSRRCGEKHMSETVTGYIDHVIFRNEDNGYTVMVLKGTKKEEEHHEHGEKPIRDDHS